jgi:hypothetical protein
MILTAHQPAYLPWLGLFDKISMADTYVFMDDVIYSKSDFSNRNKIYDKSKNQPEWLSIPLERSGKGGVKFYDIKINGDKWKRQHLGKILSNYSKTPYFDKYFPELESIISSDYKFLADFNYDLLIYFLNILNIKVDIVKASSLKISSTGNQYLIDICISLGANIYIFGEQGRNYADFEAFKNNGIDAHFQKYKHPIYNNAGKSFFPDMSIIDLLFNEGDNAFKILSNK